ncbi:MAG: hypothetical protein IIZ99_01665 [Turicibacter sp.]|nr:hypothetical protein [Turicibacter sp.]
MNEFYVYIWFREDYNTPFYIGKGKTDKNHNRAKTIKNNKHFKRIYNKVPTHVTIVEDNLSEDEAFELEKKIIKFLVNDCGYSIQAKSYKGKEKKGRHLVNCTFGGEGISGYRHTPEENLKSTKRGEEHGMYGKRGELSPIYGRKYSSEHKEKIKLNNPKRKKVYCVETKQTYNSCREACKSILKTHNIVCYHGAISKVCQGVYKHCGLYNDTREKAYLHFKYVDSPTTTERVDVNQLTD